MNYRVIGVVALFLLAGCAGLPGGGTPTPKSDGASTRWT